MFRSAPQSVCEWQRKLTQDVKLYEHTLNSKFIYGQNTQLITHSVSLCVCFDLHKLLLLLRLLRAKT